MSNITARDYDDRKNVASECLPSPNICVLVGWAWDLAKPALVAQQTPQTLQALVLSLLSIRRNKRSSHFFVLQENQDYIPVCA